MIDFASYLELDLPRINEFLEREIAKLDPVVQPVTRHVLLAGGKRLRPLLTLLTARSMGTSGIDILPMACALEFLHSATLLHDDILDGARLRRGREAAHIVFGRTETILAGDVLLALANRLAAEYGMSSLTFALADAIMRTATGEVREIAGIRNADMEIEEYLRTITDKTAYLFLCGCHCGAILSGRGEDMERAAKDFGFNLGVAFQLVDDALDYSAKSDVSGKPLGGDLREGKLTLPLIFYFQDLDSGRRRVMAGKFERDELTEEDVRTVLAQVREKGFAEKTRDAAVKYAERARLALDVFPDGEEKAVLGQILEYVLAREK
ncbi:MAG: polyprenyl synthetase family protein [Thermodesulfobacteriota bacterium]|nr:polyprenyl synthetase family protein [Thermodesulfobacteriota bacterium]